MKYLPIQQTIQNTKKKYEFNDPISCNNKCHFFKQKIFFRLHDEGLGIALLRKYLIINLFKNYMHNDIKIDWRK